MSKSTGTRQKAEALLVAALGLLAVVEGLIGLSPRTASGQPAPAPSASAPTVQSTTPSHVVIEHGLAAPEIASRIKKASTAEYVLVKHSDDIAAARAAAVPLGKLVLLLKSQDPEPGLRFLDRSVMTSKGVVRVYHDIPKTVEQARSIHGAKAVGAAGVSNASLADTRLMAQRAFVKSRAQEIIDLTGWSSSKASTLADQLVKNIASQGEDDVAVVMGHIDDQDKLRLHDNSGVSLHGVKIPGMLWVVGCNSARCLAPKSTVVLGMTKLIGYSEAIRNATELSFLAGCRDDYRLTKANPKNKHVLQDIQKNLRLADAIGLVGFAIVLDMKNLLPARALQEERDDD
jgi:hypothetical protein